MPIQTENISSLHTPTWSESMTIIRDSLEALYRADSIQLAIADSIQNTALAPSGFVGKAMPETVQSEMIVPLLLLAMFFSYVLILTRGRKMILETVKDFFYLKERSSIFIDSGANQAQMSLHLLFILVPSIALLMHVLLFDQDIIFNFEHKIANLGILTLLVFIVISVKYLFIRFLGYIFLERSLISIFTKAYFTVLFALGLGIYPLLLGLIYAPTNLNNTFLILIFILALSAFVLIFYKTTQIFLDKISSFFYIILYLCTLEILPIFIVLKALT